MHLLPKTGGECLVNGYFRSTFELLREAFNDFREDKSPRLAAAIAYYSAFAIAPLLLLTIAIAGIFFGDKAIQGQLGAQLDNVIGPEGAGAIQEILKNARLEGDGGLATLISIAMLIVAATGLFGQLQDALNTVWEVAPKPGRGLVRTIRTRLTGFLLILGAGALLLLSIVASAAVTFMNQHMGGFIPGSEILSQALQLGISLALVTLVFALIFRVLPDVDVRWRDVWMGAIITAILFTIGKQLLGLYLARSSVTSAYGAAGSLAVILLWVYYSAQILLFGAEFTQVYARRHGNVINPSRDAIPLTEGQRLQQGMRPCEPLPDESQLELQMGEAGNRTTVPLRSAMRDVASASSILRSFVSGIAAGFRNRRA